MAGFRLGCDFGTSHTVAVLSWPDGRTRPLLFDGSPLLPSTVSWDPSLGLLGGVDAALVAHARPDSAEPHPKRCIDDGTVLLGAEEVGVDQMIGAVLKCVFDEAARVAGGPVPSIVLTHPAEWGATRRGILRASAALAGAPTAGLVTEPTAAAAYFLGTAAADVSPGSVVVVYDLGAGTFDASVVRRADDRFEVLAAVGLTDAGGIDIDALIVGHLGTVYGARDPRRWRTLSADRRARRQLWSYVRAAKESLSRVSSTLVPIPLFDDEAPVSRDEVETLARPLLARTVAATEKALRRARVPQDQVSAVFLVGGSSRMPLVATMLHRALGVPPTVLEQPELVVAEGALFAEAEWDTYVPPPLSPVAVEPAVVITEPVPAIAEPVPVTEDAVSVAAEPASVFEEAAPAGEEPPPVIAEHVPVEASKTETRPEPVVRPTHESAAAPEPDAAFESSAVPEPVRAVAPAVERRSRRPAVIAALLTVLAVAALAAVLAPDDDPRDFAGPSPTPSSGTPASPTPTPVPTGPTAQWGADGPTVASVAYSPDGAMLAAGGENGVIRLYGTADGTLLGELTGTEGRIGKVVFSRDGATLASFGNESQIRLWDPKARKQLGTLPVGDDPWGPAGVNDVAMGAGDTLAAVGGDDTVQLWDFKKRQPKGSVLNRYPDYAGSMAFNPDGTKVATCADLTPDQPVYVWNVSSHGKIKTIDWAPGSFCTLAASPTGDVLAVMGEEMTRLFTFDGKPLLNGEALGATGVVSFSADGKRMLVAGTGIAIFEVSTGRELALAYPKALEVQSSQAVFSPDGRTVASGGPGGVKLWDVATVLATSG